VVGICNVDKKKSSWQQRSSYVRTRIVQNAKYLLDMRTSEEAGVGVERCYIGRSKVSDTLI
jgi:hypothetical protein